MADPRPIATQTLPAEPALRAGRTLSHGAALAIIILATLPLLLAFLGTGDAMDMMELFNLVPVKEAYRDGHWLMPTLNGMPRLEKPPLPVWAPAGLAALLHNDSLWVLRLPSVLMGLLATLATYGLGCILFRNSADKPASQRRYALIAALFLPAMLIFNRQSRLASYDIFATGFLTCGAYFLVRLAEWTPDNDAEKVAGDHKNSGQMPALRWLAVAALAGISTGLSVMSKGPVPAATVMIPLGLWLIVFHRRAGVWLGVALAAGVSVLIFLPWLVAIGGLPGMIQPQVAGAWSVWLAEFKQFGTGQAAIAGAGTPQQLSDPWYYYVLMLLWVVPLTPTFIAGIVLPFLPAQSQPQPAARERRGRWLVWLIVIIGLLMLSVPSEKKTRYALQLFPFAALLCGAVWQEFARLRAQEKVEPAAAVVLGAQALCFIVPGFAGIGAAVWVLVTGSFPRWPAVAEAIHGLGVAPSLALFAVVTVLGLWLWHVLARRRFSTGTLVLAACACVLTLSIQCVNRGMPETHTNPVRIPVEAAMAVARSARMETVYMLPADRPWLSTLFYANQIMPDIRTAALDDGANPSHADLWLMLVTQNWDAARNGYVPLKHAEDELNAWERKTGRHREEIAHWVDEGRWTVLLHLRPEESPKSP